MGSITNDRLARWSRPVANRWGLPPLGRWGWLLLAASIAIHAGLLFLLPDIRCDFTTDHTAIRIILQQPPPGPVPKPELEIELQPTPTLGVVPEPVLRPIAKTATPQALEPEAADVAPDTAQTVGAEGSGPEAIQDSGVISPIKPGSGPEVPPRPPPPGSLPDSEPEPEPEPEIDIQVLLAEYASNVKAAVLAQKFYPAIAERLGHTGKAKVGFVIDASGSLASVYLKQTSGHDELDEAAIEAVRNAAPFGAIPDEVGLSELPLSITLSYTLD